MEEENTFHLGITMAGAVSAGAYTAGFMDYLIEALELWEKKKAQNIKVGIDNDKYDHSVPMHNVIIQALGGASAGGMTGMITSLALFSKFSPVKKPSDIKTGNILYDSWVLLNDDVDPSIKNKVMTFEKMLQFDDVNKDGSGIISLLNSKSIDVIADKVFDELVPESQKRERPSYISEDLNVLVTLCSVRGIPFEVSFGGLTSANFPFSPGHRMHEHMIIAHFKLNFNQESDQDLYLEFDPYSQSNIELMKLCTKGTGAFPIGLEMRHFKDKLTKEYVKNNILKNMGIQNASAIKVYLEDDYFDFTCIDGGTINNEPYSQVVEVLEKKFPNYNKKHPMFGTIMVDPFPNFYNQNEASPILENTESFFQKNIWQVLGKGYTLFQQQVRVKREGILFSDRFRMLVFPLKWRKKKEPRAHPPLACSVLGGFGGFLDREFRKHDFFLGRDNAKNFIRAMFMLEYDEQNPHPLFKNITPEALNDYKRKPVDNNPQNKLYLPIIPDLQYPIDKKDKDKRNPFKYTVDEFPQISKDYFDKIEPLLKKRIKVMFSYEINKQFKSKWFLRNAIKLIKGILIRKVTNKIITVMKDGFRSHKMYS